MTAHTIDMLLDERSRLVAQNAATAGHLWAAEFLLKRVQKLLREAILPTPALTAHRDVLVDEIAELLAEDREHPAADVSADDTWPPEISTAGPVQGSGEGPSAGPAVGH